MKTIILALFLIALAGCCPWVTTDKMERDSEIKSPTAAAFGDMYDMSDGAKPAKKGGGYNDSASGDTWLSTWAADGTVFLTHDDGLGFDNAGDVMMRHRLCRLDGNPNESTAGFRGVNLNPGVLGQTMPNHVATPEWRIGYSSSIHEVDGVLYDIRHDWSPAQTLWPPVNSSVIKSTDGGKTWINHLGQTNAPLPDARDTMFPTMPWAFLTFIEYGKGGAAPEVDHADRYAYLTSGSHLVRVLRSRLAALNKNDFQYYRGGELDGMLDSNWTNDPAEGKPARFEAVSDVTGAVEKSGGGVKNVVYNDALKCYIGAGTSVYYAPGESGHDKGQTRFLIYVAKHPWGPWRRIVSHGMWGRAGWDYLFCNKYTTPNGQKMWFAFCGEYKGDIYNYGLQYTALYLSSGPVDQYEARNAMLNGKPVSPESVSAVLAEPVATNAVSIAASGKAIGLVHPGDKLTFAIKDVNQTGWHIVRIRYMSPEQNGNTLSVDVNGKKARRVKLSLNSCDHSNIYYLNQGDNTFEIRQDESDTGSGVLIDYIAVSREPTYNEGRNLASEAKVVASSGEAANAIKGCVDGTHEWVAEGTIGEWIKLDWDSSRTIDKVVLYDRASADQVKSGTLSFSDGSSLKVGRLQNDGLAGTVVTFKPKAIHWIKFTIDAVGPGTTSAGLGEMQVFTR